MGKQTDTEPPPTTRIEISAGGHSVVVEAVASLTVVQKVALHLFNATNDSPRIQGSGSIGFSAERCDGPPPTDVALPIPPGWPDEHRRNC